MLVGWKVFGGVRMIFDFIVKRWLGVSGLVEFGLVSWVIVKGWLLIIVFVLYIKVLRDLLFSCCLLFCNSDVRML